MEKKINWPRIIYITGIIALIIGAIDPFEGSAIIAGGSILLALSTYLTKDQHRKQWLILSAMIIFGVLFLFFFSSFGGFGDGHLSWWWGIFILPYPIGWLLSMVLLIVRAFRKQKIPLGTNIP